MPTNLLLPPRDRFEGLFADFYRAHIEPNLPKPAAVRAIHELLMEYVVNPSSSLFVVRKFEGRVRGKRFPEPLEIPAYVCGDNEPALWFYARAFLEDFQTRIPSVAEAIETRAFPIGFACSAENGESRAFWFKWGREPWENHSFGGARLYHAHLFDAARDIPSETLDRDNLTARMIRFLHPANHFPMPTHHGDVYYASRGTRLDLSELRGLKRYVCEQYAERYREVWSEFLAMGGGSPTAFPRVENLTFECTRCTEVPPPVAANQVLAQGGVARQATRFRVDEQTYHELLHCDGPLVITVGGGEGQKVHPSGTYVIPRDEALAFIESKRGQPNWHSHKNFHSVSIPTALRTFFREE